MKINIVFNLQNRAWGGGNQFIKYLKKKLIEKIIYEKSILKCDVVIFNSHHWFNSLLKILLSYNKIILHRIDGPIALIRSNSNNSYYVDMLIYKFNIYFANGTIFQSKWSKEKNIKNGLINNIMCEIILNTCDKKIFNKKNKYFSNKKISIVASSWSSNINKGFLTYKFLDENLDFNKYELTFIGNSYYQFNNIKMIGTLSSNDLSVELKKYDIYLTASINDPCSNSLIEAIEIGLLPIAFRSGGHPEILKERGLLFDSNENLLNILNNFDNEQYQKLLSKSFGDSNKDTTISYIEFAKKVHEGRKKRNLMVFLTRFIIILLNVYYYKLLMLIKKIA